jgi:hypothetical protein
MKQPFQDIPVPPAPAEPAPAETKPSESVVPPNAPPGEYVPCSVTELQTKLNDTLKKLNAIADRVGVPRKKEQSETPVSPEDQAKSLLARASGKIREQRRTIELQAARIEGFETAAALVFARPPEKGGMAMEPALEWEIDRFVTGELE